MQVQPYLFFNGRCEEAAEFYRRALGAEGTMLMRWKDHPDPQPPGMVPPGSENKVMHMRFRIGDTEILASDGQCVGQPSFQGFALSLTAPNEAEAERGCALANAAVELPDTDHPARRVIREYKTALRERLIRLCRDANLADPERLADEVFLL